jgi:hypothetical protein
LKPDRLGGQRTRDLQPALLAVREVARQITLAVLDADEAEQLHRLRPGGPLLERVSRHPEHRLPEQPHVLAEPRPPARRGDLHPLVRLQPYPVGAQQRPHHAGLVPGVRADQDVLQGGHLGEQADVLERTGDPHAGDLVPLPAGDPHATEPDRTGRWLVDPGHRVERRGLTRAVRADQAEDLSLVDGEVHAVERHHATEAQRHGIHLEQRLPLRYRLLSHRPPPPSRDP